MDTMVLSKFKGIENWAIILVPLIMILSRGNTGQIKGYYDFLTGGQYSGPMKGLGIFW